MRPTHDPVRDAARLAEIAELDLLGDDVDAILQQIATEAATTLGLPISLVSVVLDEALFVAASHGLTGWVAEVKGHPVEWSFCATSVRTREAYVVPDAATDPATRHNPMVTQEGARCYAGVPLISSRGFVLGNLCVVGGEPRAFSEAELGTLRALGARAIARIEARRP
ncbi:MAG TPA: GAF domain-containing protein [Gemmatimonadaceae bacterium]|jgi:GAF domain-containing protein|nr:GAF domain-containing protein [Gemmatimonadaceae bacterium]